MKIGITTFHLENFDFRVQLLSLIKNKTEPDFIILHYAGFQNKVLKYFRFLINTIKQYRFNSLSFIIHRNKLLKKSSSIEISLSPKEKQQVDTLLKKVQVIKTKGINDKSTIRRIKKLSNSIIVCNSSLLKKDVLNLPDIIFLNIHASKLPQYRGMNNIEWALFENNSIYVTIHKIAIGIDEGDILYQEKIDTENKKLKYIEDYRQYYFFKSNEAIGKAISKLINKEITFIQQENKQHPLLQYYAMHPILKNRLQKKLKEA